MKPPRDTPPPFPTWQTDFDRLAESASQCPVYLLFRERRLRLPWWRRLPVPDNGAAMLYLVLSLLLAAAMIGLTVSLGDPTFLFFLMVGLRVLAWLWPRTRIDNQRMPRALGDVFRARSVHVNAARDLWMAGIPGSEVHQALAIERLAVGLRWFHGLFALVVLGLVYLHLRQGVPQPYYILMYVPFAWFLYEAWLMGYVYTWWRTVMDEGRLVLRGWRGERARESVYTDMVRTFGTDALTFLALLPLSCCFGCTFAGFVNTGPWSWYWSAAAFAILAGLMRHRRDDLRDHLASRFNRQLAAADFAFDLYMAETVMEDPMGRTWATWAYNPKRRPMPGDPNYEYREQVPDPYREEFGDP